MKKILIALLTVLMIGTLSGCQKVTPESLLAEAATNTQKATSLAAKAIISGKMSMDQDGATMNTEITMDCDVVAMPEDSTYSLSGNLKADLGGFNIDAPMEIYHTKKDGKFTTYSKMMEEWTKDESDEADSGDFNIKEIFDTSKDIKMTLAEATEKIDNKDVYVLTASIKEDTISKFMDEIIKASGDSEDTQSLDFSKVNIDTTYKIFKDTNLPAEINFIMSGGIKMDLPDAVGGSGVTLDSLTVTLKFTDFNTVKEIVVPEAGLNAPAAK